MNWNNLKQKRCPECGRSLLLAHLYMRCSGRSGGVYKVKVNSLCKFTISKKRYAELGGLIPAQHQGSYHFLTTKELEEREKQAEIDAVAKKIRRHAKQRRYHERRNARESAMLLAVMYIFEFNLDVSLS